MEEIKGDINKLKELRLMDCKTQIFKASILSKLIYKNLQINYKLNNMMQNNQQVKKYMISTIRKYFEMNVNEHIAYKNL